MTPKEKRIVINSARATEKRLRSKADALRKVIDIVSSKAAPDEAVEMLREAVIRVALGDLAPDTTGESHR